MKKNSKMAYGILAIVFVIVCIIAFVIPTAKTTTFWIAFGFTVVAFVTQILIWKVALGKDEPLKSKFLGFPLIHIGIVYLVIQLIAFAVLTAIPTSPIWIPIIACILILGIFAVCLISTEAGKGEVIRVEQKVQVKMSFVKELQTDVEMLVATETDKEACAALDKLAEQVKFSDPMSDEALSSIEADIKQQVSELQVRTDDIVSRVNAISVLLTERNKKCKNMK